MKRFWFILAAVAILGSCTKEIEGSDNSKGNENLGMETTICALMAQPGNEDGNSDHDTRATVQEISGSTSKSIVWQEADSISVSCGGSSTSSNNNKFILSGGKGTTKGYFNGTIPGGMSDYYAVYPYASSNNLINKNGSSTDPKWRMEISWNGQVQTATPGTFDPAKATMMSKIGYLGDGLSFKSLFAYIKVTTNYPCGTIVVAANGDDQYLSCESLEASIDSDGNPVIDYTNVPSDHIVVYGKDGEAIEANTYLIPVLPGTKTGGLKFLFSNRNDESKYAVISTSKDVTLTRGKILNMGVFDLCDLVEPEKSNDGAYIISTSAELKYYQRKINAGTGDYPTASYLQVADIDMKTISSEPIGTIDNPFKGTYNGGNYTISNMTYGAMTEASDEFASSLFGAVMDATITNLNVKDCKFSAQTSGTIYWNISPIVGRAFSSEDGVTKITNCTATCSYNSSNFCIVRYGGIVAYSDGNLNISGCTSRGDCQVHEPRAIIGGILGEARGGCDPGDSSLDYDARINIDKCRNYTNLRIAWYVHGTYVSTDDFLMAGGILGYAVDETFDDDVICHITNCVNYGGVNHYDSECLDNVYIGGIEGYGDSDGVGENYLPLIQNCINRGEITSSMGLIDKKGGIIGGVYDNDTKVNLCVNCGILTGGYTSALSDSGYGCYTKCFNSTPDHGYALTVSKPNHDDNSKLTDCGEKTVEEVIEYMNNVISNPESGYSGSCKWVMDGGLCELQF